MKKKLTKAEKRVAIAKDVLKQLKTERYVATSGVYLESSNDFHKASDAADAKEVLAKVEKCLVCAIGSMFMSAIGKFNNCTIGDVFAPLGTGYYASERPLKREGSDKPTTLHEHLEKYFTAPQLGLIECWFEGQSNYDMFVKTAFLYGSQAAVNFKQKYEDDNDRLSRIMKNIIRNKGTFKPGDVR